MKKISSLVLILLFLSSQKITAQNLTPPVTKKAPKVFSEHGGERTDNYYWLNNPADSNVINHLKEENAYVEAYMKHTEGLQEKLYNEIVARIPGRDESLPYKQNGYWYYTRFEEGNQYPYYARKKDIIKAPEEITLDVPGMAKNYKIYLVRGWAVSKNSQQMAYGIDTAGDRRSILYFKSLATGKLMPETITNTSGDYKWFNDNKTLYYVVNDNTVRPYKVMRHTLGTEVSTDREIYT
jgi:oligopeptidase B